MKQFIIAVLLLAVVMTGCKKDLTIPNPNTPTTANFWKTAGDAQQGVNAVYSTFHRQGLSRWLHFMTIIRSDEGYSTSPAPWIVNNYDVFNNTDYNDYLLTCVWQDDYIGINRANQVLDNVPNIEMDATLKQQLLAEAKFLRGWFYYNLATIYGNVPIQLHTSKPTDLPSTSTQDEVFAQAEQDFQDAAADLPTSYDAANVGRATKGAAYAMLGKAFLQQHKYPEAHDALKWLAEGPGTGIYQLVSDYRSNFIEATENNGESVFEIQNAVNPNDAFDNDQGDGDPNHTPDRLNYGTSIPPFFAPRPIGFTDGQARRWVVWEFLKETTTTGGRDPRLAAT
ncbi:MAG TPA: RagB/SusD family nutrient uptake outer membrane protein, partial [Chitinophagaceae bacterium]|nr:RagB/SusD family nutrient uptake outer membrane protein [Chitinophagaceae bacterium]